jgi:hypothetical protein
LKDSGSSVGDSSDIDSIYPGTPNQSIIYNDPTEIPPGYDAQCIEVQEEESGLWDFMNHVIHGEDAGGSVGISRSIEAASVPPLPGSEIVQYENVIEEASGSMDFMNHVVHGEDAHEQKPGPEPSKSDSVGDVAYQEPLTGSTEIQNDPSSPAQTKGELHCILCGQARPKIHKARRRRSI